MGGKDANVIEKENSEVGKSTKKALGKIPTLFDLL